MYSIQFYDTSRQIRVDAGFIAWELCLQETYWIEIITFDSDIRINRIYGVDKQEVGGEGLFHKKFGNK